MKYDKVTAVYFSPTGNSKKAANCMAETIGKEIESIDITVMASNAEFTEGDFVIFSAPVYAGRIPIMAVDRIRRFKGKGARAVAIAVYGNRHYDDALLELSDMLSENGFQVISAAAFIAQHSIFPKVGTNRPDTADFHQMDAFVSETLQILQKDCGKLLPIHIPGNRPYKIPGSIPIFPSGTKKYALSY